MYIDVLTLRLYNSLYIQYIFMTDAIVVYYIYGCWLYSSATMYLVLEKVLSICKNLLRNSHFTVLHYLSLYGDANMAIYI